MTSSIKNSDRGAEMPRHRPAADIFENATAFTVVLDVPGVAKDAISVSLENDILEVEAHRHSDSSSYSFARSFSVPNSVDRDKISADYRSGVLTVILPKDEGKQPRRVEIRAA